MLKNKDMRKMVYMFVVVAASQPQAKHKLLQCRNYTTNNNIEQVE